MSVIINGGSTRTVVVGRTSAVNTVVQRATPVGTQVQSSVNTVVDRSDTVELGAVGVQGPQGEAGGTFGDNDTFDTNLALLYSVAKL